MRTRRRSNSVDVMVSAGRKEFTMTNKDKFMHMINRGLKFTYKNALFDELFPIIKQ